MQYKNGKDILPPELLRKLQEHVQGEMIYVPKKNNARARWGEKTGSRRMITRRNEEIYRYYKEGWAVEKLEGKFHLSPETIRKIITRLNKKQRSLQRNRE